MGGFILRSLPCWLLAAGLAAWLAVQAEPTAANGTEGVQIRAHDHGTFGRLTLEWPAPVEVAGEPKPSESELILRFDRAFDGNLGGAADRLRPYLREAVRGAAPGEVTLRLRPGTRAKLLTVGDRIVAVDLYRDEPDLPEVRVRTGRHDEYVRVVFDLPFAAEYDVQRDGGRVTVRFDRPARIGAARIARDLAPAIRGAEAESDARSSRVILTVPPSAELRHFALQSDRVVVDVFAPSGEAAERTVEGPTQEIRPPAAAAPSPPEPRVAETGAVETKPSAQPPAPPLTLTVGSGAVAGGAELRFHWSRPVAAAVFVRAGHLWAVFPATPANAGQAVPSVLNPALGELLGPPEVVAAEGGVALRFPLRRRAEPGVAREGSVWRVVLRDRAPPPQPVEPHRLADPPRLFFPGADAAVRLTDPEIGDRLYALPFLDSNRGQPKARRLVDLSLLPTAQGIVVRPLVENLRVRPVEGGVELGTPEGLRLTVRPERRRSERAESGGVAGRAMPGAVPAVTTTESVRAAEPDAAPAEPQGPGRPLDLAGVALDPVDSALAHRRRLVQQVLSASPERRDGARLDLARFLLSRALAAETLAVLGAVSTAETPAADGSVDASAASTALARNGLAGAAQLLMGRLREAEAGLTAEAFDDDPEVALWRAVLAAAGSDWTRAARELERSGRTLAAYPPPLRVRLGLTAALIALEAGRPDTAYAVLDGLKGLDLSPHERARLRFTEGLVLARDGALTAAEQTWRELAMTAPAETRQKALYALTALLLEVGGIGPEEAVTRLEAARPFWRGHPWEMTMLDGLARVHAQRRDYRRALATWKEAITRRPDTPEAAAIAEAMGRLLVTALSAEGDDAPPPLEALALHRDHPELMPSGAAGDRLTRRLAERLAAMDLIDDATALLERQVRHRLRGAAKAEAGAYLGELWLRKPAPEAALEALRASATAAELPPELQRRRRLIEVRALAAEGRSDEALGLLGDDPSREARLLRVAIHFDRRAWPEVIEAAGRLLPGLAVPERSLGREERELVVRLALAHAQLDDRAALRTLRARFGEAMARSPEGAAFAVATAGDAGGGDARAILAGSTEQVDAVRTLLAGSGEG